MVRSKVSLSRKTLAKTIARWKMATVFEAFSTWKERTIQSSHTTSKIAHSIFLRLLHRRERDAFATWRKNMHMAAEKRNKFLQMSEIKNASE